MNQPASSDSSATFMDQNNMYPSNDFQMQERKIIPGPSAVRTNCNMRITQNTAAAGKVDQNGATSPIIYSGECLTISRTTKEDVFVDM